MNRKRLFLALALGIALVLLCASAALADDPMKVSMELSQNKFTGPKTVKVSITVTNVGDGDMPGPVTLYYPSGKQVEAFGSPTLAVGASKNWQGEWDVTQKELDAGKLTFKIRYSVYSDDSDDDGNPVLVNKTKNFSKKLIYSGAEPELTVNRVITPTTAQKGQEVSISYDITNTGTADVTGVTIKENPSVSSKSGVIDSIAPGDTGSYTFTVVMNKKDLTSSATISYKSGGKTYTTKVGAETIKYGEVKLSATLKADKKGGAPGETVKLTLTLKNSGNLDFTNVTVTDQTLGTVFSGETVKAGETVTLEKELTISDTMDLQFTVKAENGTTEGVETATGRVKVIATDPTQQIVLGVDAESDRVQVYKIPGQVRFKVVVHNNSAVEVKDIDVKAVGTTLYHFDSIPAGESASFIRDTEISMAGTFQFTASCKDQLGQTLSFTSNPIQIAYAQPTAVPTEPPVVTPPAPVTEPIPTDIPEPEWFGQVENIAGIAKWALAGVGAVLLLLLLIGAVRRGKSRSESKKAIDHLAGATYRDYSTQPKRRQRSEISNGGTEESGAAKPEAENSAQSSELMAETLKRLYSDKEQGGEAQGRPEVISAAADEPTIVLPKVSDAPADAPAEAPAESAPAAETPEAAGTAHRRRGRKTE